MDIELEVLLNYLTFEVIVLGCSSGDQSAGKVYPSVASLQSGIHYEEGCSNPELEFITIISTANTILANLMTNKLILTTVNNIIDDIHNEELYLTISHINSGGPTQHNLLCRCLSLVVNSPFVNSKKTTDNSEQLVTYFIILCPPLSSYAQITDPFMAVKFMFV